MKLAILGANGQLAQDFCRLLGDQAVPLSRDQADLTKPQQVRQALTALRPAIVLNCGAYTRVDQAEAEPSEAFAVNAWGVRDLALVCRDLDCVLVHFSTNYVFGLEETRARPYDETDMPGPINTYGASKWAGEPFVRSLCPKHFVIRTCGLYGRSGIRSRRTNFVETILRRAAEGQPLRVVDDQVCTPTLTTDLARAVLQLLPTSQYGLYHLTNSGACTWFEFAQAIVAQSKCSGSVIPIRSDEFAAPACRPQYSVLSNTRWLRQEFAPLRPWQDALGHYLCRGEENGCRQRF